MVVNSVPPRIPPSRDSLAARIAEYPRAASALEQADIATLALERIEGLLSAMQLADLFSAAANLPLIDTLVGLAIQTVKQARVDICAAGAEAQ